MNIYFKMTKTDDTRMQFASFRSNLHFEVIRSGQELKSHHGFGDETGFFTF